MSNAKLRISLLCLMISAALSAQAAPSSSERALSPGTSQIKANAAWLKGAAGQRITIAVIDTGINAAHPDLAGNLLTGYNALDGSSYTDDENGHGTHVAGIIGAQANDEGIVGVAYNAKIRPVKIFDASGSGSAESLSAGIRYAITNSRILNMSLGASGPIVEADMRAAVAKGRLTVAAAGNDGAANPDWPARYASASWAKGRIIAVGAVNANNRIASYSNRAGSSRNFFLVAPGSYVLSTYQDGYAYMSGTSMATPYVSGAAAVVWSYWPYLKAQQVASALFKTATDLGRRGVDRVYGHGLVNLQKALQPIGSTSVKTASKTTTASSSTSTKISSLSTWVGGTPYAASLYAAAQSGEFTSAVVDELGRDFQTDLGGYVAAPVGMRLEAMFGQLDQQQSLTEQVLADGSRLTLMPSSVSSSSHYAFDNTAQTLIPGGFALSTQLANGDAWGLGSNGFADRFFGVGAAQFNNGPALNAPALANPLFGFVPQHSHIGYAVNLQQGMQLRVGLLSDGLNSLYAQHGSEHTPGSSQLLTTELSQQTATRYLSASITQLHEEDSLFGSQQDALFGLNTRAVTTAISVQGAWRLAPGLALAGRYTSAYTPAVSAVGDSLLTQVSTVRSDAFAVGLSQAEALRKGDRLSLTVSQPLRASAGAMNFNLPVGNDDSGTMQYEQRAVALAGSGRELRTELNYTTPVGRNKDVGFALAYRDQPDHDATAASDTLVAVRFGLRF